MSKKRSRKKINIISIIVYFIMVIISITLIGTIINLNVIPDKYLIPGIIFYLIIVFLFSSVMIKKKFKKWIKIVFIILSLIIICISVFGMFYLNKTLNFMNNIKADNYQIEYYDIVVPINSEYEELIDLNGINIGIYDNTSENYSKAIDKLKKLVKSNQKKYNNYTEASEALLNNEIDALLISTSYKNLMDDIIEGFSKKIKTIYTIEIKFKKNIKASDVNIAKDSFNLYISGIDEYGDISATSRSDVNMIVTVNPKTHKILLTSIPRDYYVQLHGTSGYRDKLTHAGFYGIDMSIHTIQDLFDIKFDYYLRVNFTTLINLVDAIGGIDIYSDASFVAWTDRSCYIQQGNIHLDGRCALAFSRERYSYIDGDRHRVKNQQDVLMAIANKALSSRTLITKYTKILESMSDSFETNIPKNNIYELINKQLENMPSWEFINNSVNGHDASGPTYSSGEQELYVMEPDMNTVEEAKVKILEIYNEK